MFSLRKFTEQVCLLLSLYLVSYQIIIFVWGEQGLLVYRKLLLVQQQVQAHHEKLEKRQRELLTYAEQISNDLSYITVEARNLGYYRKNDKLILVNTWSQGRPAPSPGNQLLPEIETVAPLLSKGIWFYALFLAACFWLMIRLLYSGKSDTMDREEAKKFPKVQHAKTARQNSRNPQNLSGYNPGVLHVEPYFPNRDESFYQR